MPRRRNPLLQPLLFLDVSLLQLLSLLLMPLFDLLPSAFIGILLRHLLMLPLLLLLEFLPLLILLGEQLLLLLLILAVAAGVPSIGRS